VVLPGRDEVERHQDVVAGLQLLQATAEVLHDAGELVAEGRPHAGIRHGTLVKVQILPADARPRDPDDGVLGLEDLGHRLVIDADPLWPPEIHGEHQK
jgi:hypothetical protein